MDDASARPPRPRLAFNSDKREVHQDGSQVLSAWLVKKRSGIGAIFGTGRWFFTLDYEACTLSWAKKPQEKAEFSLGFRDFNSVERLSTGDVAEAEEDVEISRQTRSASKNSLGARIRSMSPFRKAKVPEHGVVIRTGERSIELVCESQEQADAWLSALQFAMSRGGGVTSPKAVATQIDFEPPTRKSSSPKAEKNLPVVQCPTPARNGERSSLGNSLVMEDLDDGALTQICSPKNASLEEPREVREDDSPPKAAKCDLAIDAPRKSPKSPAKVEEEGGDTRKVFDKRELRRRNRAAFEKQITAWRNSKRPSQSGPPGLDSQRMRVCVRKRPIFPQEEEEEFDVITAKSPEMVVHNCLTKADLKSLFVGHMGFHFARVFDEDADDAAVYAQCAQPAVQYAAGGGSSAIFMFGQTGSGKTHTMQALLQRASEELFSEAGLKRAYVGAFEIAGKQLRDLQDPDNQKKELKVMVDVVNDMAAPGQLEDRSSQVATKIHGLKWCSADTATELLQLCREAQDRRRTRATQANKVSSRSHSVLRIGRSEEDICLTLVDCAGSERNEDSTNHSAQDRKDAADINSTIFALKECFRVMRAGNGQQPPFRNSLLTRVLADSLTSSDAKVIAMGTVSPAARDTEHSIETLKSLQMLQGTQMTFDKREDVKDDTPIVKHPRTWSEEEVREFLCRCVDGRAEPWVSGLNKGTDGKAFVRWPANRFAQLCGANKELGDAIFKDLRAEMKAADDSKRKK